MSIWMLRLIRRAPVKDIQSSLFFNKNELYPFYEKIEVLTNFYHRLGIRDDLGKTIPIMKFIEVLKGIIDDFGTLEPCLPWIDDTMIPILSDIEQSGLGVDREKFIDRWPSNSKYIH